MGKSNKNMDRSTFHTWINWPNKSKRKCLICGCIITYTHSNATGKTSATYVRDGITSEEFIPCRK